MTPIALYPSDASHKKSAALGAANLFFAYQVMTWAPDASIIIPAVWGGFGLLMMAQAAWRYLVPRPSFEADADGFSVMGGKKRNWDAYRGAGVHTMRIGLFPAMRWVVVKTGKSVLGRKIHIKYGHLSGPAADMAHEIDAYAVHAKRKLDLNAALSTLPPEQLLGTLQTLSGRRQPRSQPDAVPDPYVTQHQPGSARTAQSGPVHSVPKLTERLFGGRKAI